MKIPQSAIEFFKEVRPMGGSVCKKWMMNPLNTYSDAIHAEMDWMNGYICCLEIYKDSIHTIIEYGVPVLDVKAQIVITQNDDYFFAKVDGGSLTFHRSAVDESLDYLLQGARCLLQSKADHAIKLMRHCCHHHKDLQSYNELTGKQKVVVNKMRNRLYNLKHQGLPMSNKGFESIFRHTILLEYLRG